MRHKELSARLILRLCVLGLLSVTSVQHVFAQHLHNRARSAQSGAETEVRHSLLVPEFAPSLVIKAKTPFEFQVVRRGADKEPLSFTYAIYKAKYVGPNPIPVVAGASQKSSKSMIIVPVHKELERGRYILFVYTNGDRNLREFLWFDVGSKTNVVYTPVVDAIVVDDSGGGLSRDHDAKSSATAMAATPNTLKSLSPFHVHVTTDDNVDILDTDTYVIIELFKRRGKAGHYRYARKPDVVIAGDPVYHPELRLVPGKNEHDVPLGITLFTSTVLLRNTPPGLSSGSSYGLKVIRDNPDSPETEQIVIANFDL